MDVIGGIMESLAPYAAVRRAEQPGTIAIDALNDEPLSPPAIVVAPAEALANYIRASGADARAVHPDVGPEEGGFRLLLVHIVETVLTKAQGGTIITIEDDEITVRGARHDDLPHLDPADEYEWVAEPPNQS